MDRPEVIKNRINSTLIFIVLNLVIYDFSVHKYSPEFYIFGLHQSLSHMIDLRFCLLSLLGLLLMLVQGAGQKREFIDIDSPFEPPRSGHLKLGGENFMGRSVEVNSYYVSMEGKPVIPVTGEFHYSRYPEAYWEEAIQKMRAGGITIIATYVFWNIHEEREGNFDWEGSKDLRKFLKLCSSYDYDVIVRIGPFCHGEIRNGGLPDWLLAKPVIIRSNDPNYLSYVEKLYDQIGRQLQGLYFRDGGPVLGIQLENEYQHSAAPWGLTYPGQPHDWTSSERDRAVTQIGVGTAEGENPYAELGNEHMKVLKGLAIQAGIEVPLYTATGWGHAAIIEHESLPVTAAYPYPTWAPEEASGFYLYTRLQEDPDYAPVRYESRDYPYFAAELGGGIMNTYHRRPLVPASSLAPMINRFLGSGANGIGYYMYHGGATPRGEQSFFSDVAIGCPFISYDFQAPIGEFGQVKPSFYKLKPLHMFLHSFGDMLAPMQVHLPDNQKDISPYDTCNLRYSIRSDERGGFLFLNNFQDHLPARPEMQAAFSLNTENGEVHIPEAGGFTLLPDQHAILPFGQSLGGYQLNYATSQLLTLGRKDHTEYYVFFSVPGMIPEYSFANSRGIEIQENPGINVSKNRDRVLVRCESYEPLEFTLRDVEGREVRVLTIPLEMAEHAYSLDLDGEDYLAFSSALVLNGKQELSLLSKDSAFAELFLYPDTELYPQVSQGSITQLEDAYSLFSSFRIQWSEFVPEPVAKEIQANKYSLILPDKLPAQLNDLELRIDYLGDTGMGFLNGELVLDHFYNGRPWNIGLRKFIQRSAGEEMVFYFRPLYESAPFLKDLEAAGIEMEEALNKGFELRQIEYRPEYRTRLIF